jgi:putative transposase
MARKTRIEFPGAIYHVLDRGDRRESIYGDDEDRRGFLTSLGEACQRTGWRIHAYVLMSNHYHLMLETPEPNLVAGMHWFQTTWTMRFNRRRGLCGHVLQGRYKAVVVDPSASGYFAALSDYIHLNPVRAGIVGLSDRLFEYVWSSYPAYAARRGRPSWLETEVVLGELGLADSASGRRQYARRMRERTVEELAGRNESPERNQLRRGWCLGGEGFREEMLGILEKAAGETERPSWRDASVGRDYAESDARRLLARGLTVLGLTADGLEGLPRGDERKAALAAVLRSRTTVSNAWTAQALSMGHPSRVTHSVREFRNHPLRKKLEAACDK